MPFKLKKYMCLALIGATAVQNLQAADPTTGLTGTARNDFQLNQVLQDFKATLVSSSGEALIGATIRNLSNGQSVETDEYGVFTISARPNDKLIIESKGYRTLTYTVPEKSDVKIALETEEVITVSEGKRSERIYTSVPQHLSAASTEALYSKDILKSPVTSVRNTLTGRIAGLYSVQGSGQPGSDGVSLSLRGMSPIIIVDGVVANLSVFNLEDVESATLVKDALGAAMLGVRGSNGALVITTKKGKADKQQISFTVQSASQRPMGYPKTLSAYNYANLYNEALQNDGLPLVYTKDDIDAYGNGSDPFGHPDVNWRKQILEDKSRFNRYTFNATGGNKFARYYVGLEHVNQSGFFKTIDSNKYNTNNDFKSYVIRSNVDVTINPKLTGGIYLLGRILNGNDPGSTTNSILASLFNTPNNAYPVFNANGTLGGTSQFQNNIYGMATRSGYRQNYKRDMMANFYLRRTLDEVTKGLYAQVKIAAYATLSENITRTKSFAVFQRTATTPTTTYLQYGTDGTMGNSNGMDYQGKSSYQEYSIGYDRNFGKHGFNALAFYNSDNSTSGSDLPLKISGGSGRVSYNYDGKYVIEGAFAYNGSNRYPEKGSFKRGFFPAVGAAWNIERENFMKQLGLVSKLKLYGSVGQTGWDNPGYFSYIQRFFDASSVIFGTSAAGATAITEQPIANPNISFEQATKINVGLEGSLFKDRLSFGVEYYNNKYFDLLMQRGKSTTLIGGDYPDENIGTHKYYGVEARLGWQDKIGSLQYFIAGNAALQDTKVIFVDEVFRPYEWMKRTGQRVGQRFGYVADGLFQSQQEIAQSATTVGYTPQPGDIRYKDLNEDGVIDQFDIAPIGNKNPLFFFGVSLGAEWKGLDFSALIQGVENREVYLGGASLWAFQNGGFGQAYEDNLNRWTPQTGAKATYPRLNIGANTNNQANSSYWLKDGSYIRLKQIELGYTIPQSMLRHIRLQSIRVFASAYNLLTFSSGELGGRDPEVFNGFSYPIQKLVNFGINIKL